MYLFTLLSMYCNLHPVLSTSYSVVLATVDHNMHYTYDLLQWQVGGFKKCASSKCYQILASLPQALETWLLWISGTWYNVAIASTWAVPWHNFGLHHLIVASVELSIWHRSAWLVILEVAIGTSVKRWYSKSWWEEVADDDPLVVDEERLLMMIHW